MPTSVEDIVEATTAGVLRALDARRAGSADQRPAQTTDLLDDPETLADSPAATTFTTATISRLAA
jgi:hypothetical protein